VSTIEIPRVDNPEAADAVSDRSAPETPPLNSSEDGATRRLAVPAASNESTGLNGADGAGIAEDGGTTDGVAGTVPAGPDAAPEYLPVPVHLCPFCGFPSPEGIAVCTICGQPGTPLGEGSLLQGRYRIGTPLALSSTGSVYEARDEKQKRDVAIKELFAPPGGTAETRAALAERFKREAKQLASLKHPCLPEILDRFTAQGRLYLVMPLLPSSSLQVEVTQRGRGWGDQQVQAWGLRLLELLEYLGARKPPFVHGEILPEHIVLKEDGTPCLLSYGIAPRLGLRPYTVLPGQVVVQAEAAPAKRGKRGKNTVELPAESAVERNVPPLPPTPRDDLYAVGAVLHELLTARDVFAGADQEGEPFPPVRRLAPRVSVGMAEAVGEAVAADPRRRFQSAGAMRAHLLQRGSGPPAGSDTAPSARPRSPLPLLLLLLLVIVAVVVAVIYAHNNAGTTSPDVSVEGEHEVNPIVLAVPVPTAAHTVRFSDTFTHANNFWPKSGTYASVRDKILWLSNLSGTLPVKVTRAGYATGHEGYVLNATLRLNRGGMGVGYGVVAADRGTGEASNVSLIVRGTGQWALFRYKAGVSTPLVNWKTSTAIRTGHNAPNRLRLTLNGGAYTVTINGRKVAGPIAAGADTMGRVGLVAWPGAVIACDELAVAASPPAPGMEENFLNNSRDWSANPGGLPFFHGALLRLRTTATQKWQIASSAAAGAPAGASAFTADTTMHATSGKGGLVFARDSQGNSLAVIVGNKGNVSVVRLGAKTTHTLAGPIASPLVRTGYGLNLLHLVLSDANGTLRAQVVVNGGTVLRYATPVKGLTPTVALTALGENASIDFSVLRIAR
jgi:serine/threonine protein kinase